MAAFAEYERYDGLGLAELVEQKEVRPRELVEAAIARIEARNGALNAVVHPMFDKALRAADDALPAGPFRGVPLLLKDLVAAYAGEPVTGSCRFLKDMVPDHDSELVARLKRAGFLVLGKTNTPELGIMGVTEPTFRGPTRNPWDTGRTPGGSSGGSAAAVAAGMVPLGHGGDGGGSIRIPASCCGLFGLKPTRGRNPLGPDMGEGWGGLVQEHAITRSVRDSAALLDAVSGPDVGAPYFAPPPERPFLEEVGRDPGRLRIAFTTEALFGGETHPDCVAAVHDAARLCESLGHEVVEARPTFDMPVMRRAYLAVVSVGTARIIDWAAKVLDRTPTPDQFEPETWMLAVIGRTQTGPEYLANMETMQVEARRVAAFFETHDVLLTPTLARPPSPIGAFDLSPLESVAVRILRSARHRRLMNLLLDQLASRSFEATSNTMLFNETGQPAMSVPLYWSGEGLPIGTQFVGRYGREDVLLRLAAQLEEARPWAERRPPGFTDLGV